MKRKPIFLTMLALSLFMFGLLLAGGTMAGEPTLRITINPRTGPPGTAITVTGEGAHTDKPVKVAFVTSGEGGTSLAEVEVTPQTNGTFTAVITVPTGVECKTYAVRAQQTNPKTGNLIHYWWNSFTVTGVVVVTPGGTAPVEPTATSVAPVTPEATAPIVPTISATVTVTATATTTPAATTAATPTTGGMPTTGGESTESSNTMVIVIVIVAAFGVLAAFGVGLRQARKA